MILLPFLLTLLKSLRLLNPKESFIMGAVPVQEIIRRVAGFACPDTRIF
jgi:hypothetical protein